MRLSRAVGARLWRAIGKYPDWAAILVGPGNTLLLFPVVAALSSATMQRLSADPWTAEAVSQAARAALVIALIAAFGWLRSSGLVGTTKLDLAVVALALAPMAAAAAFVAEFGLNLGEPWASDWPSIVAGAAVVALAEEVVFRGVLASAMRAHGSLAAVGLSAMAFALSHVTNQLMLGNPVRAVAQGLSTFGMGSAYGAARLRSGTIWPGVIGHAANNVLVVLVARLPDSASIGVPLLVLLGSAVLNTVAGLLAASRLATDCST